MFTGIVEETGSLASAERRADVVVLTVRAKATLAGLAPGASIAVNGCCLTAIRVEDSGFACELTEETLSKTSFGERVEAGRLLNLERPMRADGRFDGHIVQGHVDGVGRVLSLERTGDAAILVVEPPAAIERYLVAKGSIAVDGISLTVAELAPRRFTVALIPLTLERTNLRAARSGDPVNLEADVIAKYVERLVGAR